VIGEVIAERYELEELIGIGGMASVYRARDRQLERTVALKLLHDRYSDDDDYVERFRREARAAARLSHPNVVTLIDRGEQDGRQFIVFEHVGGETLKELVDRTGPLPVRRALELALQIGRALASAHGQGLVHRDVKPQNVLLGGDGRPKVTDFGIARSVDVEGATTTGVVIGTSHYIAPEQARGEKASPQSDVYSLGAVLYELLAGEVPFPGDNFVTVAMRHVREPPPSLLEERPEVPARVASAVDRALEKDPAKRFPSMNAFVVELQACLDELGEESAQEPTQIIRASVVRESKPVPARARRSPWPLLLILAGLAIGAIVAGLYIARDVTSDDKGGGSTSKVRLTAVASYDPEGDNEENSSLVPNATDGSLSTAWESDMYNSGELFGPEGNPKGGIGIVLDARRPSTVDEITVQTSTPDFTAVIKSSDRPDGGFVPVSDPQQAATRTTFPLEGEPARYFLLWITELNGINVVRITDVKAG
jgi:serine/threonine protein kinase